MIMVRSKSFSQQRKTGDHNAPNGQQDTKVDDDDVREQHEKGTLPVWLLVVLLSLLSLAVLNF